jgi:predicted amidophosphoribosyltransferase
VSKCKYFKNKSDFVEVKHGEWIEKEDVYGDIYYTCSVCNNDWTTIDGTPQENFMKFCPCCGAKMDGGVNDG